MSYPAQITSILKNNLLQVKVCLTQEEESLMPFLKVSVAESRYLRLPLQVGDWGLVVPSSYSLQSAIGAKGKIPAIKTKAPNMSAFIFMPFSRLSKNQNDPNDKMVWPDCDPDTLILSGEKNGVLVQNLWNGDANVSLAKDQATLAFKKSSVTLTEESLEASFGNASVTLNKSSLSLKFGSGEITIKDAVISNSGISTTDPTTLRQNLVNLAEKLAPGVATDLPGTLVEDMASTATGALSQMDAAKVEMFGSFSPLTMNPQFLNVYGAQMGITRGTESNASAYLTIKGTSGTYLGTGFQFSDGQNIYATTTPTSIPESGVLNNVYVSAISFFQTSPAANSITQVNTSLPTGGISSVTNPTAGTPGIAAETDASYRLRIWQSLQAQPQGSPTCVKNMIGNIDGVVKRTISCSVDPNGYRILVDGGDPSQIAGAIYASIFDISRLLGSAGNGKLGTTVTASVLDGQDQYNIQYIRPAQQQVTISISWGITLINAVDPNKLAQLAAPPVSDYINGLYAGQPISLAGVKQAFLSAFEQIADVSQLNLYQAKIFIDGAEESPAQGEELVYGDTEAYFVTTPDNISIEVAGYV
ncbi:hypothetical protein RF55_10318 [Lasius niger]|uniref:Uncharacterized protein n=1 Tax=Lasius niger TaxID=67767 RepID=A0A0J7KI86_LASNI|nr:hypothetical protein RF55_10318 [Lasius niger]